MARTHAKMTYPTSSPHLPETSARNPATSYRNGPSHEQISRRAYELFLARGAHHGRHEDDWFQAERELKLGR